MKKVTFIFQDLVTIAVPIPLTPSWKDRTLHWLEASTSTEKSRKHLIISPCPNYEKNTFCVYKRLNVF